MHNQMGKKSVFTGHQQVNRGCGEVFYFYSFLSCAVDGHFENFGEMFASGKRCSNQLLSIASPSIAVEQGKNHM